MKHNRQKGFGIIETLVAIFLITVGLLAILGLSNSSIQSANYLKMKLVASFLAQEGVETIRFMREANSDWNAWEWYDGNQRPVGSSQNYLVQYDDDGWPDIANRSFSETSLKIDKGAYQYSSGTNSPFYRKITLSKPSDNNELKVEVEVKWQDKTGWQYIRTEDRLWNWR